MARITVEDCIDKFPSRFELVLVASNRARKLHTGETPTVERDNDKNTVIALREIADETVDISILKNDLIEEYQTTSFSEDEEILEIEEDVTSEKLDENILDGDQKSNNEISDDNKEIEVDLKDTETFENNLDNENQITDAQGNLENDLENN